MSIKLMDRCWRCSSAKGGELLVLLGIADFANDAGVAYPSVETLAKKARLTPRNTQRAIRRLVASGELQLEEGKGLHGVHVYRILLSEHVTEAPSMGLRSPMPEGCQNVGVTNCQDDKRRLEGVTKQPPNPLKRTVIKKEKKAGSASPVPARGTLTPRSVQLADEIFIAELKANPAYAGIDIDREMGKCRAWLLTPKGKGKQLTRSRLVNWLNRIDIPLTAHGASSVCTYRVQAPGDQFIRNCGRPASPDSRQPDPRCPAHLKPLSQPHPVTHATD